MKRLSVFLIFLISIQAVGQDRYEYKKQVFASNDGDYLNYRLLYPLNYLSTKKLSTCHFSAWCRRKR